VLEIASLVPLDDEVLDAAAEVAPVELRSLDAIHLASALSLGDQLSVLITYDERMLDAAKGAGVRTAVPS
jgi:uncharacterized protein